MIYHSTMKQKGLFLLLPLSLVFFIILNCISASQAPVVIETESQPEPVQPGPVEARPVQPEPVQQKPVQPEIVPGPAENVFDPGSISEEQYEVAMAEVKALIADLNLIIRDRNYNAWVSHLADSYFREISAAVFLEERTEELFRRDQIVARNMGRDPRTVQRRVLRTTMDYFVNIVVPSRSNDRVDEIEFVSRNRVKAYTVDTRGTRLVLYDLEIIDGRWKIVS